MKYITFCLYTIIFFYVEMIIMVVYAETCLANLDLREHFLHFISERCL